MRIQSGLKINDYKLFQVAGSKDIPGPGERQAEYQKTVSDYPDTNLFFINTDT